MSKEFTIPPVIFPSGGNPNLVHRRVPTAPFSPPAPPYNFSRPIGVPAPTSLSDPPLLEELGINPHQIWTKARPIFNPFKTRTSSIHSEADLSGPFLFYVAFGLFQLLNGKLHFGVLLGWIFFGSVFIYIVFNMTSGRSDYLDLHRCLSLVGCCSLPLAIFSAVSVVLPARLAVATVFVWWSARVCVRLLVETAACGDEHQQEYTLVKLMGTSAESIKVDRAAEKMEDEEEDLFEINFEALNDMPPPHYWESYSTTTGDALLANCLLPISDLSNAVPLDLNHCESASSPRNSIAGIAPCHSSSSSSSFPGRSSFQMIAGIAPCHSSSSSSSPRRSSFRMIAGIAPCHSSSFSSSPRRSSFQMIAGIAPWTSIMGLDVSGAIGTQHLEDIKHAVWLKPLHHLKSLLSGDHVGAADLLYSASPLSTQNKARNQGTGALLGWV
ncbi:hypothetical protein RJ641_027988 [Dillenia turbinata]|uniref:Protein YIP n=1 Tax=Dillenia turbinata TaxID=194707 RepID=A0AAN8W748_9MAGN